jgi:hypothetical protein
MKNYRQNAIKNIVQKMLNLNDITCNKRLCNLIGRSFEMPYVSYCQHYLSNYFSGKTYIVHRF